MKKKDAGFINVSIDIDSIYTDEHMTTLKELIQCEIQNAIVGQIRLMFSTNKMTKSIISKLGEQGLKKLLK